MSTVATFFMIVAIMAFISWAGFARVIRGMAASVRSAPFVDAGRALGASRTRLLVIHVIPTVLGFAAVIGDLAESIIKRSTGVKDSGSMFPGIGGALDLIDSLLFTAPLLFFYFRLIVRVPS